MNEDFESKGDILATIERRFQFIIVLALFLPFIGDNLVKISSGVINANLTFTGIVISFVFIIYLLFEIFRKKVSKKSLEWIALLSIVFSYTLIVTIWFGSNQIYTELDFWKAILLDLSILFDLLLPATILIMIIIDPLRKFVPNLKLNK